MQADAHGGLGRYRHPDYQMALLGPTRGECTRSPGTSPERVTECPTRTGRMWCGGGNGSATGEAKAIYRPGPPVAEWTNAQVRRASRSWRGGNCQQSPATVERRPHFHRLARPSQGVSDSERSRRIYSRPRAPPGPKAPRPFDFAHSQAGDIECALGDRRAHGPTVRGFRLRNGFSFSRFRPRSAVPHNPQITR